MTIIQIEAQENGFRSFQSQSHRRACWLEGYVEVPEQLISAVIDSGGWCDLIIEGDILTGVVSRAQLGPDLEASRSDKLSELSTTCNTTITSGCAVTLSDGTQGHISMTDEDQINLLAALSAVQTGGTGYPYHLDGDLCRVYPAADIVIMATAATQHKLYHTTYCNHLNVWVRRCETVEEVQAITYGTELPEDLAANMLEVLGHVE